MKTKDMYGFWRGSGGVLEGFWRGSGYFTYILTYSLTYTFTYFLSHRFIVCTFYFLSRRFYRVYVLHTITSFLSCKFYRVYVLLYTTFHQQSIDTASTLHRHCTANISTFKPTTYQSLKNCPLRLPDATADLHHPGMGYGLLPAGTPCGEALPRMF